MDSAIVLPFCKYNFSLNKYLYRNSSLDIDLDNFYFYNNFNKKLNNIKKYFFQILLPQGNAHFGGQPQGLSTTLEVFSKKIVHFFKVNPYLQIWEEELANWPTFPGASLLHCCRTTYDVAVERAAARDERLAAKKARMAAKKTRAAALRKAEEERAYKLKFKKVRSLVVEARRYIAILHRAQEARILACGGEQVPQEALAFAMTSHAAAQKQQQRFAHFVWRVKQARRAAQEAREAALYCEIAARLSAPVNKDAETAAARVKAEEKKKARAFYREVLPVRQSVFRGLMPYQGLGSATADPMCKAILACERVERKSPRLAQEIYAFVMGRARQWAEREMVLSFCTSLTSLVDFYPEEVLVAELKDVRTQVDCVRTSMLLSEENAKLQQEAAQCNARANIFRKCAAKLAQTASSMARAVYAGCENAGASMATGIMKVVMKHFYEAIGVIKIECQAAMGMINALVERVQKWVSNITSKLSDALVALGKYAFYAVCVLLGFGLVRLVQQAFGVKGVVLGSMFGFSFFATIVVAKSGWDHFSKEFTSQMVKLGLELFGTPKPAAARDSAAGFTDEQWFAFKSANNGRMTYDEGKEFYKKNIHSLNPEYAHKYYADYCPHAGSSEECGYNAKSIPLISSMVQALSNFGASLCSLNSMSVIEIGKLAAALHSMRMGKEALKEFAASICHYMGILADKITGRETVFFDELSTLVSVDVRGWIRRAQGVILESHCTDPGSQIFGDTVSRLIGEGHKIQLGVGDVKRKLSSDYAAIVGQIMRDLTALHKRIMCAGIAEGRRPEPAWIYIFGKSHCGKSNYMTTLGIALCKHFDYPYTVCVKNAKDQFFSGYRQQSVLQLDDLSSVKLEPPFEADLINLVSCQDVALNMADVDEKPIYFRSPFVVSSSNQEDVPAGCGVRDVEAYRSRKLVLLEMRRKPGAIFDPEDPMKACQARFKNPMDQTVEGVHNPRQNSTEVGWMDMEDVTTEILNRVASHRAAQDKMQAAAMRQMATADPMMLASEHFLQSTAKEKYIALKKVDLEKAGLHGVDATSGLCVDGTLYAMNSLFDLEPHKVPVGELDYAKLWEKQTLEIFVPAIASNTYLNTRSMVVSGFLRSLVNEDCAVISVDSLSSNATSAQVRIFQALKLPERVYLRCLQKSLDQYRADIESNPYSQSCWSKVIATIVQGKDYLERNGATLLLMAVALLLVIVLAWGFWKAVIGLFTGSLTLAGALAGVEQVEIKSNKYKDIGGFRSRNVPVQQRYRYARSSQDQNLLPASRLCVGIFSPRGHFTSAMQYKGKTMMMTRHQARAFLEGEELTVIYTSTGESKMVRWHSHHTMEMPGSEIVLWMAPSLASLPTELKDLFLEDKEVELPNYFHTEAYVLRKETGSNFPFSYRPVSSQVTVDRTPLPIKGIVNNDLYIHEIPEKLAFHYKAENNDCGMLITCQLRGKMKVVGLLVAGEGNMSWADILPNPHLAELKAQLEYEPEIDPREDPSAKGFFKMGFVEKSRAPAMPTKTNLVAVPESLRVPCEVEIKEPSVISKVDSRCPEGVDPPMKAMEKKFTTPMLPLEQDILDIVAEEIVETWYDCSDHDLADLPLSVAINGTEPDEDEDLEGFIMKTSPGYPYIFENRQMGTKGKSAYFEDAPDGSRRLKEGSSAKELYENLEIVTRTQVPELVVIECPKDELLPLRKVKQGACRLFEIMPLHYNLLLRVKTGAFTSFMQKNRQSLPCQVGTNPYSRDWSHIYQRLLNKNDVAINCDYSGFDGLLIPQLVECMAKMINALYAKSDGGEIPQKQRFNMLMALCGRYAFVGQKVMRVNCGLPSGFAMTVVMNSIFNEILIRYAYRRLAPGPERNSFGINVCLLVYGDDNLISTTASIANWFNGESIRLVLKEKNITITDGSDKLAPTIETKPLSQLDFLKRRFLKIESGVIQAPLDRSAIFSSLYWLTPDKSKFHDAQKPCQYVGQVDVVEELVLNVNVALVELYLHNDREEFDFVRRFYIERLPLLKEQFRTWAYCEAFHSAQQTGMKRHDPVKVLDHLTGPEFRRFMTCSGEGDRAHFYTPQFGVCGPFYRPQANDYIVSTQPLRMGENGQFIPVQFGSGVGRLPTKAWVQSFARPSVLKNNDGYHCWNAIKSEFEAGKRIIFRSPAPYVACNAALISFMVAAKLGEEKQLLTHYRNVIPESTDGLEKYFDSPVSPVVIAKSYFANAETFDALQDYKVAEVLDLNEATETQALVRASKLGKVPCFVAKQHGPKHVVALVCNKDMCPFHKATGRSFEEAFKHCWLSQCKTKCNLAPKWFGTKFHNS
nr:replication-related polyprotein [Horse nettle virus A]